jgi:hypothetical protein
MGQNRREIKPEASCRQVLELARRYRRDEP